MLKEAWTLAIEALSWMEMRRLSERLALAKTVQQLGISDADAVRLAHMLVCETVRRRNFIDTFINKTLEPETIDEFDLGVQAFLRLYVYQTRIAKNWSKIDIKEAENIAKLARSILGWKTLRKVERILGELLTQKPKLILEGVSDEERIGLLTFHPTWFVKYCLKTFGRQETITLLEANMQSPLTYIRVNTLKAGENEILKKLVEEGIKIEKVEQLRHAYKFLSAKKPLTQTTSFREGLFYIQDKASCFAAETANPKPGMTVLDACAAPGAKTTYLAQLMQNQGDIFSVDYSKRRMNVWKNEVARMGVANTVPIIADACSQLPFNLEADIVVLDPPCTSTGAFGKLPSAKWRLTRRSIDRMAEIQWRMINNCAAHVKSGGTLVYSTCSITLEENEIIIERFLKWHPEFALAEITPKIGLPALRGLEKCQRLYPHIHQCNGFFIAKLSKE
ncbi:MAG: RsmB/NOP family class I SAM-dependent RNA methyltransferase [Candidatus Bathyarchaeota archaeon]|nr:RsmB/NOP family class I SAM-dependent RNA methyltransferase [Candidatus Bathyarchaeota archaeon A05DMB-5]MDH7557046.1 RsmB/NOP family class I SAM-dependent RNA methyltransferase [Candidatus Bathyarchaeota archaeon]